MITTKLVQQHNDIYLVEWIEDGVSQRALVTPDMIVDISGQSAIVNYPERGIPFGEDWTAYISQVVTPSMFNAKLKQSGIWTIEDLQSRPNEVHGALLAATASILQELLSNVKLQRSSQNGS